MPKPLISIVFSVYNAEPYLLEVLQSIQAQTLSDFEAICVDDDSTDGSLTILNDFIKTDSRFFVRQQKHLGLGAARNCGFREAVGQYVVFMDGDVSLDPTFLEKNWNAAERAKADVAVCDFVRRDKKGTTSCIPGISKGQLSEGISIFHYKDCPHRILNIWNPEPWNKLFRHDFLRKYHIQYDEISSQYDIAFAAVSAAAASQIVYVSEPLMQYEERSRIQFSKSEDMHNLPQAVVSVVQQTKALAHRDIIWNAIRYFVIDHYIFGLKNLITDFQTPEAEAFYTAAHNTFRERDYGDLNPEELQNQNLYREFLTVRKQSYERMKELMSRKLIVSLTSFPARIGIVAKTLAPMFEQTHPADKIILWLAPSQFPGKEEDLPQDLLQLVADGLLEIRWGRNLMPHMKYFYSMQAFPEDLVVTIDDDIIYPKDMLEKLYKSYLMYPEAVSAMRAHLILLDENNGILPYNRWIKETDACIYEPSMQLFATGVGGVLYPPKLFDPVFFDEEAIVQTCLRADDLWLKAMEAISDVPVVVADRAEVLGYLPGSQETALCHSNVDQNQNDVQLAKICEWLDRMFEPGILRKKLIEVDIGVRILRPDDVISHLDTERKQLKVELRDEKKKGEQSAQLLLEKQKVLDNQREWIEHLLEDRDVLRNRVQKKDQLLEKQKLVETQYRSENQQLLSQVRTLKESQQQPKLLLELLTESWKGRPIAALAWLPCRYLRFLQCVRDHGFLYTVRQTIQKVIRSVFGKKQNP